MPIESWSPAASVSLYRSTSLGAAEGSSPLMRTLRLMPSCGSSAVSRVSPTSPAGAMSASAVTTVLERSVLVPPAVDTVIRPAETPAGTVSVSSC